MKLKQLLDLISSDTNILVVLNHDLVIKPCNYPKYKGLKIMKLSILKGDDALRVYITTANGN